MADDFAGYPLKEAIKEHLGKAAVVVRREGPGQIALSACADGLEPAMCGCRLVR